MARSASTKAAVEYDELFDEAGLSENEAAGSSWSLFLHIPTLQSQFVDTTVYCILHFQKHPLHNMPAPRVPHAEQELEDEPENFGVSQLQLAVGRACASLSRGSVLMVDAFRDIWSDGRGVHPKHHRKLPPPMDWVLQLGVVRCTLVHFESHPDSGRSGSTKAAIPGRKSLGPWGPSEPRPETSSAKLLLHANTRCNEAKNIKEGRIQGGFNRRYWTDIMWCDRSQNHRMVLWKVTLNTRTFMNSDDYWINILGPGWTYIFIACHSLSTIFAFKECPRLRLRLFKWW